MVELSRPQSSRAFEEMKKVAVARLQGRQLEDISQKGNIPFDKENSMFSLSSLGIPLEVRYPDYTITPAVNEWHQLVLLHYMDLADGMPLSQQWITMSELKDGMVRGGGFDRDCEAKIRTHLGCLSSKRLIGIFQSLGAEIVCGNADVCAVFGFLPQYPVMLKVWLADDELPGSGRMLVNKSADHYLTIEDAVTVGGLILDKVIDIAIRSI